MKVYAVFDKYSSPSGIQITTGVNSVYTSFKSLIDFLNKNKESYLDIETTNVDNGSQFLYFVLYKNNLGYYDDPKLFVNIREAEKEVEKNFSLKKICKMEKIEIKKS